MINLFKINKYIETNTIIIGNYYNQLDFLRIHAQKKKNQLIGIKNQMLK